MAAPSSATDTGIISLRDLIDFISHVADCYPDITKDFPQQLIDMLTQHHLVLGPDLREKIVGSLMLLKKKDLLDSATYVAHFVPSGIFKSLTDFAALLTLQTSPYTLPGSHLYAQQISATVAFPKNSVRFAFIKR